ncbi:LVIVD repeat-containing protein [Egicoccus sp. AB-alg6-2]|uniref:LVIVD repeat-containing protein n=1 Tax=Egicoccus sp. AB-alg6-2 TaxID=3242692 RepID=UPI00359DDD18
MTRPEERHGLRLLGHSRLNGYGDGMQVLREGDALYVGHFGPSGMGTSILDVSDVTDPRVVRQWEAPPGSHTHKVQVADGLLLVNHEQFRGGKNFSAGMAVYDLADPFDPKQIGWFDSTGKGVHRIVYTGGRYAYMSAIPDRFEDRIWVIVDLDDPTRPVEVGRWWWPGQRDDEEPTWPEGKRYAAHHALIDGDRAYLGYNDAGMVILDISDVTSPQVVSKLTWDPVGDTHTCLPLPGRDLLVVTDEEVHDQVAAGPHYVRVVDISDDRNPEVIAVVPPPEGDYATRGLRFGPHNTHENRPGSYRSAEVVFVTYFNAGLRVYDLADPADPVELAHYLPPLPEGQPDLQINDVFVADDGLIYITDRWADGVYILEPEPELRARMEEARL